MVQILYVYRMFFETKNLRRVENRKKKFFSAVSNLINKANIFFSERPFLYYSKKIIAIFYILIYCYK